MNGFITAPAHNKPNRPDATGAFHVGAKAFQALHSLPQWKMFENDETDKHTDAKGFLKLISDQPGGWDVFAYFGHGNSDALSSADLHGRKSATMLANALIPKCKQGVIILLYACNAGAVGGFAQWLADDMSGVGATVYGHLPPKGHTFTNPRVMRYPDNVEVIPHTSALWGKWCTTMKTEGNTMWARFPFMTAGEIEAELTVPPFLMGRWEVKSKQKIWHEVFLDSLTVVRTEVDSPFLVVDQGSWSARHYGLSIKWKDGATEEWEMPINTEKQVLTHLDKLGNKKYSAKRIEGPEFNTRKRFIGIPHPKQSHMIQLR